MFISSDSAMPLYLSYLYCLLTFHASLNALSNHISVKLLVF